MELRALLEPRTVLGVLALGRVGLGAGMVLAPRLVRPWVGPTVTDDPGGRLAVRALGVRDLALGAGVLASRESGPAVLRVWAAAGVAADAVDAVATVAARRPGIVGRGTVALAAGAALAGGWAVARLGR